MTATTPRGNLVGWTLACPVCRRTIGDTGDGGSCDALACSSCDVTYPRADGVWHLLAPERANHFAGFLADYTAIRHREGRGSDDAVYYQRLPDIAPDDALAWQWSMRARTFEHFVQRVLPGLGQGLRIVDVGAGVGWLSNRLAALGHQPLAVDLSIDDRDGLGALRHYQTDVPGAQAEFDRLPVADGEADVVVFNASLHYSIDYAVTLAEALRVLRPHGAVVVLDSPIYHHERSGAQMVAERHADFERRFGTRSDSIASIEYLTDERIEQLGDRLGIGWRHSRPWYGWRWASRPLVAKLKRRREPSRFVILVGRRHSLTAGGDR